MSRMLKEPLSAVVVKVVVDFMSESGSVVFQVNQVTYMRPLLYQQNQHICTNLVSLVSLPRPR